MNCSSLIVKLVVRKKRFIPASDLQVDLVKITEQGHTLQVIRLHGSGRAGGESGEKGIEKKILSIGKRPPHPFNNTHHARVGSKGSNS